MPTEEQILIRLKADIADAEAKFKQLESEMKNMKHQVESTTGSMSRMSSSMKSNAARYDVWGNNISSMKKFEDESTKTWNAFGAKGEQASKKAESGLSKLGNKFEKFGMRSQDMLFGGLAGGYMLKSLGGYTVGAAAENQNMENLLTSTMKNKEEAQALNKEVREASRSSMVGPNQMLRALGVLKMSTGIDNEQLKASTGLIRDMGQNFALQGFSGKMLTDMMSAGLDGLVGEWRRLRFNLGVDEDDLKKAGWSGKKEDVEGYLKAMNKLMKKKADLDGSMDSTTGRWRVFKNELQLFAIDVGYMLLPVLDGILKIILAIPGPLKPVVFGIGLLTAGFIALAPIIALFIRSFREIKETLKLGNKLSSLKGGLSSLGETLSNIASKAGSAFSTLKDKSGSAFEFLKDKTSSTISSIKSGLSSLKNYTQSVFNSLKSIASSALNSLRASAASAFASLRASAVSAFTTMKAGAISAFTTMKAAAISAFTAMKAGAITAFNAIKTGLAEMTAFMAANPYIAAAMAIIIAIILIVTAIEKLGEYMGWWDDWGGMAEAFKASLINAGQQIYTFFAGLGQSISSSFQNIKNYFSQLWNSIHTSLQNSWIRISTYFTQMGQRAYNFGRDLYNKVVQGITGLAKRIGDEFRAIPGKIREAIAGAVKAATDFGKSIVNAANQFPKIHSPGVIQKKIAGEFKAIPGRISENIPNVNKAAQRYGANIVHGFDIDRLNATAQSLATPVSNTSTSNRTVNIGNVAIDAQDRSMYDVAQEIIGLFESVPQRYDYSQQTKSTPKKKAK